MFANDEIIDDSEVCEFVGDEGATRLYEDDIDDADLVFSLFNEIWSIDTLDSMLDLLVE